MGLLICLGGLEVSLRTRRLFSLKNTKSTRQPPGYTPGHLLESASLSDSFGFGRRDTRRPDVESCTRGEADESREQSGLEEHDEFKLRRWKYTEDDE